MSCQLKPSTREEKWMLKQVQHDMCVKGGANA